MERYGIGEMPSPNHKGWRTGGGSHGSEVASADWAIGAIEREQNAPPSAVTDRIERVIRVERDDTVVLPASVGSGHQRSTS
jgi:hypothetical protein